MQEFQVAAGTITGNTHYLAHQNNQDGYHVIKKENYIVGVVCDGNSNGKHNEVGANFFARVIAAHVSMLLQTHKTFIPIEMLNSIMRNVIENLSVHVDIGEEEEFFRNYLAFNVTGFYITENKTVLFGVGDGVVYLNGEYIRISRYNPGYFAAKTIFGKGNGDLMKVVKDIPTNQVNTMLVGTDGVSDLAVRHSSTLPCSKEQVGPIKQFWTEDKFFRQSGALARRLSRINMVCCKGGGLETTSGSSRDNGILPDDTTMIVLRRNKNGSKQAVL